MQKYSIFSLVKNALSNHETWDLAWKDPTPKKEYDVVIIGGGGHGLATAYYLAKEHNITNVAIIEKGWIGGGALDDPVGGAHGPAGCVPVCRLISWFASVCGGSPQSASWTTRGGRPRCKLSCRERERACTI